MYPNGDFKDIPLAVLDLDGCLFDDEHRLRFIRQDIPSGDEKYEDYHKSIIYDGVIGQAKQIVIPSLIALGYSFLICTARPEKFRAATEHMIDQHYPELHGAPILMRPDGDTTPSATLKAKLINDHLGDSFLAADGFGAKSHGSLWRLIVDDREDVLSAFELMGFTTIQCARSVELKGQPAFDYLVEFAGFANPKLNALTDPMADRLPTDAEWFSNVVAEQSPEPCPIESQDHPVVISGHSSFDVDVEPEPQPEPQPEPVPAGQNYFAGSEFIKECCELHLRRDSQYGSSRFKTAKILEALGGYQIADPVAIRGMSALSSAMVKFAQFAKDFKDAEALSDFMGSLVTLSQCGSFTPIGNCLTESQSDAIIAHVEGDLGAPTKTASAIDLLASRMQSRHCAYGDVATKVARIIEIVRPNGTKLISEDDMMVYHLFDIMTGKIVRFVNSEFTHTDSLMDAIVIAGMIIPHVNKHDIKEAI
ncbi:polynucleotide kinase/phosphorylase [Aeromonas phage Gekk3-15]